MKNQFQENERRFGHPCRDSFMWPEQRHAALQLIGSDKAAQIAMQQQWSCKRVVVDNDIDFEDGVYEVEFVSGGTVYDYKIKQQACNNGMSYLRTEPDEYSRHKGYDSI